MKCNNCGEEIKEFGCDYNADVTSHYSYDEVERKFKLASQNLDNDKDTVIYCTKCGKTFSDEIIDKLNF